MTSKENNKQNEERNLKDLFNILMNLIPNIFLICFVGIIFYRMIFKGYQITIADAIVTGTLVLFSSDKLESLSIGEKGVAAKFKKVEEKIENINYLVAKHILTNGEKLQLELLARKDKQPLIAEYSLFLEQEMIRLCQHGFVQENHKDDLWKMREHGSKQEKFDLRVYFEITEEGRKYFELITKLEKQLEK